MTTSSKTAPGDLDGSHFRLDAEHWTAFLEALAAPPRDHPHMRRLLQEPSLFETASKSKS
ncbi:MAG: DUF1778 domain-containing protein [Rhodomicrobium sp.]